LRWKLRASRAPDVDGPGVELLLPVDVERVVAGPERPAGVKLSVQLHDPAHGINAKPPSGALREKYRVASRIPSSFEACR